MLYLASINMGPHCSASHADALIWSLAPTPPSKPWHDLPCALQVCMDERRTILILPCMHTMLCQNCVDAIMKGKNECPLCSGHIESAFPITV